MAAMRSRTKRRRPGAGLVSHLLLLAAFQSNTAAAAADTHAFPYVPTQILGPGACVNQSTCRGRDVAYVFSPSGDGVRFLALNYSAGVDAGAQPKPVSADQKQQLPFLRDAGPTAAFGAARAANGEVLVFAGACDGPGGDVWSYTPDQGDDSDGEAKWERRTTTADKGSGSSQTQGPFFLGGTLAFSSKLAPAMDAPTLYTYGGMCAPPATSGTKEWQSDANYTKTMTSLTPAGQDGQGYTLGVASVAGPRSPFAGFSVTQLPPSMTNISGSVTQQASFVFLGGHTQWAFINMSTAAVWSLPEETWSYVNVQPPLVQEMPGNELAKNNNKNKVNDKDNDRQVLNQDGSTGNDDGGMRKRDDAAASPNVYSRSGHTAVLSEDGGSVVVLGGWVGDVATPAEPQLAVLEMSQAYSSWRWRIPKQQPDGGIYGHGAAMLPGNVMMVYGGWETSASTGKTKHKRQDAGSSLRFLNLTSMAWTSSYTNPNAGGKGSEGGGGGSHDAPGSGGSSRSKRLGLGLGLGLGLALLLGIVFGFLLWRMRQRRRQARHDEAVRAMADDARHFLHDTDMIERDNFLFGWGDQRDWRGNNNGGGGGGGGRSLGYESLRGGASRTSLDAGAGAGPVTRKPVAARGMRNGYQPALPDSQRFSGTFASPPGVIHPILEDDEDEYNDDRGDSHQHHHHHLQHHHHPEHMHDGAAAPLTPTSEAHSDPFATPVTATAPPVVLFPPATGRAAATPSPESPVRRTDPDVQDWVSDVDAADALLTRYSTTRQQQQQQQQQQGRVSPTRRGSNRSTLTLGLRDDDSRTGSNLSESARSAADSLRRSASGRRSAAGFFLGLGAGVLGAGAGEHSKPGSSSSSSYNTARSGFGALQAEAPGLLMGSSGGGGGARAATPGSPTGWDADADDDEFALPREPGSPSKSKAPSRRTWLGSLRRVFSGSSASPASTSRDGSPRRPSLEQPPYDHWGDHQGQQASSGAALLAGGAAGGALSGELLRRKQGRHDWQDSGDEGGPGGGGGGGGAAVGGGGRGRAMSDLGGPREKDEWDIERAVEQRLVQVMFTVPKERLRVVNADYDHDHDDDDANAADDGNAEGRSLGKGDAVARGQDRDKAPMAAVAGQQRGEEHVAPAEALREPHVAELVDPSSTDTNTTTTTASSLRSAASRDGGLLGGGGRQQQQQQQHDDTTGREDIIVVPTVPVVAPTASAVKDESFMDDDHDNHGGHAHHHDGDDNDDDDDDVFADRHHVRHSVGVASSSGGGDYLGVGDASNNPRLSHSTDGSGRRSSGVVMTAEAVTFERPRMRMRVRDMVDRYETRSQHGGGSSSAEASPVRSQADSPTRGLR